MLAWMAWTWQSALFFCLVVLALIILTLLAIYRPETPRVGILRFPTTRGDRFFVSLIGSAFIFVFWLRFGGGALWYPLAASVVYGIAMFRFA
jgi:predicted small integral membrane protein